ncbi:dihydrofolate reductase family protein [Streptomyces fructofermentans]|uniref:Deaminase reductase n=1 Tax=Streptomyces fructofermentans TaxID=152141 RepID=A0A918NC14_9ACTN|nr:dihydrofolate reductase family protein [Streptomyces fructofermentans]GGX59269.1 deaminase reductase [Streptomyces fructofermentans]
MSKVVLHVTLSLDGFMAGPDISVEHPMGRGGLRLHDWILNTPADGVDSAVTREVSDSTGAVVLGRRTFDVGVGVWRDTPFPVPCLVLTHHALGPRTMRSGTFTFVTDGLRSALRQAKSAADGKDVALMGADTAQQAIGAGLVDEINLQIAPVLLGDGRRLFEHLGPERLELERTRVLASPHVTHLRFRVPRTPSADGTPPGP